MIHHDKRDYAVAVSEAASKGRVKMQEILHKGLASAQEVIEQVQNQSVRDRIAVGQALTFDHNPNGFTVDIPDDDTYIFHPHASRQLAEKAGVPYPFLENLLGREQWGKDVAVNLLNEIYEHDTKRHLIRSVEHDVRGFLSDRFRRIDSRPLVDAFVGAIQPFGAVPLQGYALDTKVRLRAALPVVFEPIPNEVMLFGVEWGNSDFGDGGHCVSLWQMRIYCTNLAICDEVLRQVHLGKRLEENIAYSDQTYKLDTQANASALKDVIAHSLSPLTINKLLDGYKEASEKKVSGAEARAVFKRVLHKEEAQKAIDAFESPDVQNLPAGDSVWRMSNAVSWIAQANGTTPERQLELQKIAGNMLPGALKAIEV